MSTLKSQIQNRIFQRDNWLILGLFICSISLAILITNGYGFFVIAAIMMVFIIILCIRDIRLVVILAMISGANLGLISNRFAMKLPNGDSFLEIRDVFLILILVVGFIKGWPYLKHIIKDPFITSSLMIAGLIPMAAIVGMLNKGDTIEIAREMYTLGLWILPLVIAANIRDKHSIIILIKWILIIGSLVALGAATEVLSGNAVRLVSNVQAPGIGQAIKRAIPDGNVYFTLTSAIALALILKNEKKSWLPKWVLYGICVFMLGTSFLILLRTTLVTNITTACILTFLYFLYFKRTNIIKLAFLALLSGIIIFIIVNFFINTGGQYWTQAVLNRFLNTFTGIPKDGRIYEMKFVLRTLIKSPILGVGLGAPYMDPYRYPFSTLINNPSLSQVHNIFGFFLVKMGLPGLLAFLYFCIVAVKSLFLNIKRNNPDSVIGIALSIGIISLIIHAMAGNIFGSINGLPIAMITTGLLVSYNNIKKQELNVI